MQRIVQIYKLCGACIYVYNAYIFLYIHVVPDLEEKLKKSKVCMYVNVNVNGVIS